jgi:hypothetical protein
MDAGGVMTLICDRLLRQQQKGHAIELSAAATEVQTLDSGDSVLLLLLCDDQYMHELLSSLPGVDPQAPVVQEALQQLRALMLLQQQECKPVPN